MPTSFAICVSGTGAPSWTLAVTRIGRAVKAGRRPPVGEALTARWLSSGCLVLKPVRASWSPYPLWLDGRARCALVSSSPWMWGAGEAELGCLVMSSPGPDVFGSEHGAIRRSQQCSITYNDREGHADYSSCLLAASEPAHVSSRWARQRISPSRSP